MISREHAERMLGSTAETVPCSDLEYTEEEIRHAFLIIWERPGVPGGDLMWHVMENEQAYACARTLLNALAEARGKLEECEKFDVSDTLRTAEDTDDE